MKLLIITQKVDRQDPILGFFHLWIKKLSEKTEKTTVIGLGVGDYALDEKVKVLSLGKENGASKLVRILRFYKYLWQERKQYDSVFVHMNEEYVLLAGLWWRLTGKRVTLWRNHARGTWRTDLAIFFSNRVFATSPTAYVTKSSKTRVMPAGINVEHYLKPGGEMESNSVLFFGRVSPVKNVHIFVDALKEMKEDGVKFRADIIGSPANPEDHEYEQELKSQGHTLVVDGCLSFRPAITHEETASLFKRYAVYVNLTPSGSFDKVILESMASETPVLVLNKAFDRQIPEKCLLENTDPKHIAEKVTQILTLFDNEREKLGITLRHYVEKNHSLNHLVDLLTQELISK